MTTHKNDGQTRNAAPSRSKAQSETIGDFGVTYEEELRASVEEIESGEIDSGDEDHVWLQKWWAVRVRVVLDELAALKGNKP